jgi:hypothetical protein
MTAPPPGPNLSGIWTYSATASLGDTNCKVSAVTFHLTQTNATFSGTYTGQLACTVALTDTILSARPLGNVINGTVAGHTVTFDLDSVVADTGTVDSSFTSMSGTLVAKLVGVTLSGTWTATKN